MIFFGVQQHLSARNGCACRLRPSFHLSLQVSQRGAQLVRSIGYKTAMTIGLFINQRKQSVQRSRQRLHLGRRALRVNGTQVKRRAALYRIL